MPRPLTSALVSGDEVSVISLLPEEARPTQNKMDIPRSDSPPGACQPEHQTDRENLWADLSTATSKALVAGLTTTIHFSSRPRPCAGEARYS